MYNGLQRKICSTGMASYVTSGAGENAISAQRALKLQIDEKRSEFLQRFNHFSYRIVSCY